jgi:hypothetical protein
MNSRTLIRQLRDVAKHVKNAAEWKGSGFAVDGAKDHYVYELLCYLTLCKEVAQHFKLKLVARYDPKTKKPTANWPKSPGRKEKHSYFRLQDQANHCHFELCPGIKVADQYDQDRAADINLLRPSDSLHPTHTDVCGIWDAKYRVEATRRIEGPELFDFVLTYEVLKRPTPPEAWSNVVSSPFQRSGLLTNGQFSTEPLALLVERGVQETATYPDTPQTRPAEVKLPIARPAA